MDMGPVLRIIFMIALAAAFTGCDEEEQPAHYELAYIMDIENGRAWFSSEGGTQTFYAQEGEGFESVMINYYYYYYYDDDRGGYTDPDWCTVSVSGQDGVGRYTELTVTLAPNSSSEARSFEVELRRESDMALYRFEVVQSGVGE